MLYVFATDRSGDTPAQILGGTRGTLVVDGYTGYNNVTDPEGRARAGCWCHLRRKLFEARREIGDDGDVGISKLRPPQKRAVLERIDDAKLWLPESKRGLVDELVTCVHERIPYGASAGDVFLSLSKHIEDLARERAFPVLLVDEAHLIHQDTLDHLHILLNYAWDSKALLSLVLIGLPDLNERLLMRRNRSLHSRLTYRLSIEPLSPNDTAEYIRARLATAGTTKELFTSDAIAIIHEAASGSLRDIDRVAHSALRNSARRKRKLVERDVVQAILQADVYAAASP